MDPDDIGRARSKRRGLSRLGTQVGVDIIIGSSDRRQSLLVAVVVDSEGRMKLETNKLEL